MKTIVLLLSTLFIASAGQSQTYTRYNANTPQGQADLDAMNKAFEIMRNDPIGCGDGISWYYQGAIHNIPSTINGPNALCPKYQTSADKLWAWGDCTHTGTDNAKLHFLLWHRMYTWHLEKIVRKLSGKADFAMPYWNYGGPTQADNTMAAAIRNQSGSLYEPARLSTLNAGDPIQAGSILQIRASLNEIAVNPVFGGDLGFSRQLEIAPHGFMHTYIGGGYSREKYYNKIYQLNNYAGLMANVPSAGFDPVFWLHHSMVDRIWESWDVSAYGVRPTLAQLKAQPWPYQFIEPDGTRITYTMDQVFAIVFNMDYKYDNLLPPPPPPAVAMVSGIKSIQESAISLEGTSETNVWEQVVGKVIGEGSFSLEVVKKLAKSTNKSFKKDAGTGISLELEVSVYKQPEDYYTVHLRYPGQEDKYLGMMTFFGVNHEHGTGENHTLSEEGVHLQYSYYVSDDLMSTKEPFEIIITKNGTGDAKVTLEKIKMTKMK